jgi:DNA-binding Xre family transcriptional regulator
MAFEAELGAMKTDGMTFELDYRWHLRKIMAIRGIFATTDLRPLLVERGVELSQSQVYRLVTERPERLNLRTLMALLDILDCTITDLIEPLPARGARRTGRDVDNGDAGTKSP